MFNNKKEKDTVSKTTNTVIGSDTIITGGVISGQGSVRIDGQFIGEVNIGGQLVVGESGSVEGNTKAESILLAGNMRGNITCESSLHLVATAMLKGDMHIGNLIVDEGGKFVGNCNMIGQWDKKSSDNNGSDATPPDKSGKDSKAPGKVEVPY